MQSAHLEFGRRDPDRVYADRPAAFGLAERDGKLALVCVTKPGKASWHDLPGGAVDPGETEEQALVREFGEEAGLVIRPEGVVDRAAQYFVSAEDTPYRNHGPLMTVEITGEEPALKIEDDHELVWVDPDEAVRILRHDSHAWAVARWLRRPRTTRP